MTFAEALEAFARLSSLLSWSSNRRKWLSSVRTVNLWQDLLLPKPWFGRRGLSSFLHLEEYRRVTDGARTRTLL
jgi:hypothetical protein